MSRHNPTIQHSREAFICKHCGSTVKPPEAGGYHRNHCPNCLWSLHVDLKPGDRRSSCRGLMEPIAVTLKGKKELAIIHKCTDCGFIRLNRIAGDDNELLLFTLAETVLKHMPFPAIDPLENIL